MARAGRESTRQGSSLVTGNVGRDPPPCIPSPARFPAQGSLPAAPGTSSQHRTRSCRWLPAGCPAWSSLHPPALLRGEEVDPRRRTSAGCAQRLVTCYVVWVLGDFDSVVGRKNAPVARPHVVGLVPIIFCLHLHQQRIVHLQLQLIRVARHKPGQGGTSTWPASSAGGLLTGSLLGQGGNAKPAGSALAGVISHGDPRC